MVDPGTVVGAGAVLAKFYGWLKGKLAKDSERIKNEMNITYVNCNIINATPEDIPRIQQLVELGEYGIAKKRLAPFNAAMLSDEGKDVVKALKPYLKPRELAALKTSYSIMSIEMEQMSSDIPEILGLRAQDMKRDLNLCHPFYGVRIYNLATTGAFEYLASVIPGIIQTSQPAEAAHANIRGLFDSLLSGNKSMVFTNSIMTPGDIRERVGSALKDESLSDIFVFARGVMVDRVNLICSKLGVEHESEFLLSRHLYNLGSSQASANVFTRRQYG